MATKADLDAATDKLNDALDAAEAILLRYAKGAVPAYIDISNGQQIGVCRLGTEWQLVWIGAATSGDSQPLSNAPRAVRMEAAYKLDDLRLAVLAKIDVELQAVSVAAEVAWNFYRAYEGPSRGEPNL